MQYLIAILIICFLVIFHEFGHFLAAKMCGVGVTEFAVGMGPKLFGWTSKKSGTVYSVHLFPIGGFCAMRGEGDVENPEPDSFEGASVWKRMIICVMGPVFNLLLGFIAAFCLVAAIGQDYAIVTKPVSQASVQAGLMPGDRVVEYQGHKICTGRDLLVYRSLDPVNYDTVSLVVDRNGKDIPITYDAETETKYMIGINMNMEKDDLLVTGFLKDSPAKKAGLQSGDKIVKINGEDAVEFTNSKKYDGSEITVDYMRGNHLHTTSFKPVEMKISDCGFQAEARKIKHKNLLYDTAIEIRYDTILVWQSLYGLVTGRYGLSDFSSPVGVVKSMGDSAKEAAASSAAGASADVSVAATMVSFMILLTVNLGILNLLPLPALDGGHLAFYVVEAIRRKRVRPEVEARVHQIGLAVLMAFSIIIIIKDVVSIWL